MKYHDFNIKKTATGEYDVTYAVAGPFMERIFNISNVTYKTTKEAKKAIDDMLDEIGTILGI